MALPAVEVGRERLKSHPGRPSTSHLRTTRDGRRELHRDTRTVHAVDHVRACGLVLLPTSTFRRRHPSCTAATARPHDGRRAPQPAGYWQTAAAWSQAQFFDLPSRSMTLPSAPRSAAPRPTSGTGRPRRSRRPCCRPCGSACPGEHRDGHVERPHGQDEVGAGQAAVELAGDQQRLHQRPAVVDAGRRGARRVGVDPCRLELVPGPLDVGVVVWNAGSVMSLAARVRRSTSRSPPSRRRRPSPCRRRSSRRRLAGWNRYLALLLHAVLGRFGDGLGARRARHHGDEHVGVLRRQRGHRVGDRRRRGLDRLGRCSRSGP